MTPPADPRTLSSIVRAVASAHPWRMTPGRTRYSQQLGCVVRDEPRAFPECFQLHAILWVGLGGSPDDCVPGNASYVSFYKTMKAAFEASWQGALLIHSGMLTCSQTSDERLRLADALEGVGL